MNQSKRQENGYQSRTLTSLRRLACWAGAWVAATALMVFGPVFLWNKTLVFTLLAVGLNVGVGVGLILAHKNYIAELDELQRKIYLDALAITLGVGLIAGIPYEILDRYDVIPFQADIAHLLMLMSLTFVVTILYVARRYR